MKRRELASTDGPRRVLVTGASRGIGRAVALALARDGFDLALGYLRRKPEAEQAASEIAGLGREASLLCFDVADREACAEAIAARHREPRRVLGRGQQRRHPRRRALRRALGRGLGPRAAHQPRRLLQRAAAAGAADGARAPRRPHRHDLLGRRHLGQSRADQLRGLEGGADRRHASRSRSSWPRGRSPSTAWRPAGSRRRCWRGPIRRRSPQLVPLQRLGTPDDVAAAVAFLFSAGAGYITAQVLSVNGGIR